MCHNCAASNRLLSLFHTFSWPPPLPTLLLLLPLLSYSSSCSFCSSSSCQNSSHLIARTCVCMCVLKKKLRCAKVTICRGIRARNDGRTTAEHRAAPLPPSPPSRLSSVKYGRTGMLLPVSSLGWRDRTCQRIDFIDRSRESNEGRSPSNLAR